MLPSEWIVRKKDPDVGIDLEVEIVEKEKVTNKVLWVQLKATGSNKHGGGAVSYPMGIRHLKYYENWRIPVLVLLWIKPENAFYYLFAQRYIREELSREDPNWRTRETKTKKTKTDATKTIKFAADSRLRDADALNSIATDGYLYIIQQEPSVKNGVGLGAPWLDGIPKSNDEVLKERTLKALLCMRNENYYGAIAEYKYILKVVCKTSSTERMAILLNLGYAHYSLGQNAEALDSYGVVLELAKEISGQAALAGKAAVLGKIGLVYAVMGDLDNALKCHEDALKIHREVRYRRGEASDLGNIGLVYSARGDLDNALKNHQVALRIDREIGHRQGEIADLGNIGVVYRDKGDLDNALIYLLEALILLDRHGLSYGRNIIQKAIGSINERSKR